MPKAARILALLGLIVAIGCALAAIGAGLGYRFGWWHYRAGISTLGAVFWIAAPAALVCAVIAVFAARVEARGAAVAALVAAIIAGITAWIPYDLRTTANALPPIHDITTDFANPPQFSRIAAMRQPDEHPVAYDGPKVGEQQKKAYPDIAPFVVEAPRENVFAAAQSALASMGLEVVDADPNQGRLEATATSLLFGFKDDVVVRIAADGAWTRIDVRSKSRVGRNDLGMNAKRIRAFMAKLKAAL